MNPLIPTAALCALTLAPAAFAAAAPDPFTLPSAGRERAYACTGFLNAYSAMVEIARPGDPRNEDLMGLHAVLSLDAHRQGKAAGDSLVQISQSISAWSGAVVDASMTEATEARAKRMGDNLSACRTMAEAVLRSDASLTL